MYTYARDTVSETLSYLMHLVHIYTFLDSQDLTCIHCKARLANHGAFRVNTHIQLSFLAVTEVLSTCQGPMLSHTGSVTDHL